ncbi:hypothetical protein [uncultured Caulobacter sp.]|uniref:M61 family metallopeptidase n=1 Tax=uncultured Caulobacter sp. TaxID=158749 RepID=UPI002635EB6E|nr:hypothetical protein [uncultured Caulobacter sp.]
MRRFSFGVVIALFLTTQARAELAPVRYVLSPVIEKGALRALAVDIDFKADLSGVTRLRFFDHVESEKRPGRYAEDLVITGADRVTPLDGDQTEIRSAPGAPLHARYRIRSGYAAPPTTQDVDQTRPIILPDWFYTAGEMVFAFPAGRRDAPATFTWAGAPEGFAFDSNLTHPGARTVEDILHSILIGSPRLRTIRGGGRDAGLRIAALGAFDRFDDPAFAEAAFAVVRAERAFWGDRARAPFLIALAPLRTQVFESYSGRGLDGAFALWVGTSLTLKEVLPLLAHEHFHAWNPAQLGAQDADRSSAWLSEGFTDFYTKRMLLRAGMMDLPAYVASWNEWLRAYGVSPARNAPEARIAQAYWTDHDVEEITYKRGAMLAALFDAQLRRSGKSLDAVMREMRSRYRHAPESRLRVNFEAAFQTVAGRSALADIDRYETRGETLSLPTDAFACLQLRTVTQPAFDLGFDADATAEAGHFTGVDPAGPAYAAGLRDGMTRLGREGGAMNDSSVEIVYRVTDATGQERVIRYRPVGKTMVTFQRLEVPAGLSPARTRACVRTLGGPGAR